MGQRDRLSRAAKCAPSRSRTRCTGCATIASTGCGSMRCTPSSSRAGSRCCTISARAAGRLAAETGRHIHLVLENDDNRASLLDRRPGSAAGQISRAMERRLSSRLARAADRRERRAIIATTQRSPISDIARALVVRLRLSGRSLGVIAAGSARRAERPSRRRSPSSISCRTTTRSAIARWATASKALRTRERSKPRWRSLLLAPACPDAVHGRGMGLDKRPSRSSAISTATRRRRAQGPPHGIRLGLCGIWRRSARSACSVDIANPRCSTGTRATLPRRGSA